MFCSFSSARLTLMDVFSSRLVKWTLEIPDCFQDGAPHWRKN
jgi:hypothetical protein